MAERKENDFYPTPKETIDNFLENYKIRENSTILEPCAGCGNIVKALQDHGYKNIKAVEIRETEAGGLDQLVGYGNLAIADFLKINNKFIEHPDVIITNPPFSIAMEILNKSLECVAKNGKVIMLLRLGFMASLKRFDFMRENPPTEIYVLHKRPSFVGKGTDSQEYAWFVWDKEKSEQSIKVI